MCCLVVIQVTFPCIDCPVFRWKAEAGVGVTLSLVGFCFFVLISVHLVHLEASLCIKIFSI